LNPLGLNQTDQYGNITKKRDVATLSVVQLHQQEGALQHCFAGHQNKRSEHTTGNSGKAARDHPFPVSGSPCWLAIETPPPKRSRTICQGKQGIWCLDQELLVRGFLNTAQSVFLRIRLSYQLGKQPLI
jgi:hypothetical protein